MHISLLHIISPSAGFMSTIYLLVCSQHHKSLKISCVKYTLSILYGFGESWFDKCTREVNGDKEMYERDIRAQMEGKSWPNLDLLTQATMEDIQCLACLHFTLEAIWWLKFIMISKSVIVIYRDGKNHQSKLKIPILRNPDRSTTLLFRHIMSNGLNGKRKEAEGEKIWDLHFTDGKSCTSLSIVAQDTFKNLIHCTIHSSFSRILGKGRNTIHMASFSLA